jgi:hypothetical protein
MGELALLATGPACGVSLASAPFPAPISLHQARKSVTSEGWATIHGNYLNRLKSFFSFMADQNSPKEGGRRADVYAKPVLGAISRSNFRGGRAALARSKEG